MKTLLPILAFVLFANTVMASSPNRSGSASATMNVSVTVVEPAQVNEVEYLTARINGEQSKELSAESQGVGRISIPSHPHSEMLLHVRGESELSDGNGGMISFEPTARISRNVVNETALSTDGHPSLVTYTESDNGGYRGIAELELYGRIDTGDHSSGSFKTSYTVTTEHL